MLMIPMLLLEVEQIEGDWSGGVRIIYEKPEAKVGHGGAIWKVQQCLARSCSCSCSFKRFLDFL